MDVINYSISEEKIKRLDVNIDLIDLEINNDGTFLNLEKYILSFITFVKNSNFKRNRYPVTFDDNIKTTLNKEIICFLMTEIDNDKIHETINEKDSWIGFQYKDYKWFLQKNKYKKSNNNKYYFRSVLLKLDGDINNDGHVIINENLKIIDDEAYEIILDNEIWEKLVNMLAVISYIQRYVYKKLKNPHNLFSLNINAIEVINI